MHDDIHQSFFIDAPPARVAQALLEEGHIRAWWTREARIDAGRGVFGWSDHGWEVELRLTRTNSDGPVTWHCVRSNMQDTDAWVGTTITFVLAPEAAGTRLDFAHTGYWHSSCREACHQGWAFFVGTSLRQYLETGRGIPWPDIQDTANA